MRPAVFLDTSAWFAALSPRDQHHARAERQYHQLIAARAALLTTALVVAEMHALFTGKSGGRDAAKALQFLDRLYQDPLHEVVWATRDLEHRAVDRWLRPFAEHRFSLADAIAFEVMHERGLRTAFALDRHFAVAGFELVPPP